MSALTGIRIVELAESVAGEYCGKLLADFGAEVIKVERPGGSPTRALAPLVGENDGSPERSAVFAYLNTSKRSVVVTELDSLVATADAVIGELSVSDLAAHHPSVVFCSITPYGIDAAPELQNAQSLNVFHSSGWGLHTPSHADPAKAPLKGPGRFLADYEAGQKEAATKVLARVKAAADRLGVDAETVHVPEAQPAEAIVATAKERHCNLVVMASHGRRGLRRLLLGSQTAEVLVSSSVPVLVVR